MEENSNKNSLYLKANEYFENKQYEEAFLLYQKAFKNGIKEAEEKIADCYAHGYGVKKSVYEALTIYQKEFDTGYSTPYWSADYLVNKGNECYKKGEYVHAYAYYLKANEKDNAHAAYNLGLLFHYGKIWEKDLDEAEKWYQKATIFEMFYEMAYYQLALIYREKKQYDKMKTVLIRCPDKYKDIFYGDMYFYGYGCEKDYHFAAHCYRSAIEHNAASAYYKLALVYEKLKDYKACHEYVQQAIDHGNTNALFRLGMYYKLGIGVEPNKEMAYSYIKQSADKNNRVGKMNLAYCYRDGIGVEKDSPKSLEIWFELLKSDFASAYAELGKNYIEGEYFSQDIQKGLAFLDKGIELDGCDARFYKARYLLEGMLLRRDVNSAYKLYVEASEKENLEEYVRRELLYHILKDVFPRSKEVAYDALRFSAQLYNKKDQYAGVFNKCLENYLEEIDKKDAVIKFLPDTYVSLGKMFEKDGTPFPENKDIAEALFKKASAEGSRKGILAHGYYFSDSIAKQMYTEIVTLPLNQETKEDIKEGWRKLSILFTNTLKESIRASVKFIQMEFEENEERILTLVKVAMTGDGDAARKIGGKFKYAKVCEHVEDKEVIAKKWFSLAVEIWENKVKQGYLHYAKDLYFIYLNDLNSKYTAGYWGQKALACGDPHMYFEAGINPEIFDIDKTEAVAYLRKAASMGHDAAQLELDTRAFVSNYERRRMQEARDYQRQQAENVQREKEKILEEKLDAMERTTNAFLYNELYTNEERALRGDVSMADQMRDVMFRDYLKDKMKDE